ncbi:MAG: septal ring lytic transglycosylase RlpA family protein [Actinomycetota bacterium]
MGLGRFTKIICFLLIISLSLSLLAHASKSLHEKKSQVKEVSKEIRELQAEIDFAQELYLAINSELEVTGRKMLKMYSKLDSMERKLEIKRNILNTRLREIYKNGSVQFLEILLGAGDFKDFLTRIAVLSRIIECDLKLIDDIQRKKSKVEQMRKELAKEKLEQLILRRRKKAELSLLKAKLTKKQVLLINMDRELRNLLKQEEERKQSERLKRAKNSLPLCAEVRTAPCYVQPYVMEYYITGETMPKNYRATGLKFYGVASWYGNEFNGRPTSSGEIFNENDFTCASIFLPFGTYLGITYGDKHIVVRVNDRGPFIDGRMFDLSKAAAQILGLGLGFVQAEILEPDNHANCASDSYFGFK